MTIPVKPIINYVLKTSPELTKRLGYMLDTTINESLQRGKSNSVIDNLKMSLLPENDLLAIKAVEHLPILRDVFRLHKSDALLLKNKMKKYYESSAYRKKLRKAGISERIIGNRVNDLHDADIRMDLDSSVIKNINTHGLSNVNFGGVVINSKYAKDQKPMHIKNTILHELTHHVGNNMYSNRTDITKNQPFKVDPDKIALNNQISRHNTRVTKMALILYGNLPLINQKMDTSPRFIKYFISPEEMRAKITPLLILALERGWSPKQTVRFLSNEDFDQYHMYHLFGDKGIAYLLENILKKGGKLWKKN